SPSSAAPMWCAPSTSSSASSAKGSSSAGCCATATAPSATPPISSRRWVNGACTSPDGHTSRRRSVSENPGFLAALELRRALVLEGGDAFAEVVGPRRELEGEGLVAEVVLESERRPGVHEPLGEAQGDGRAIGELQ